MSGFSGSFLFTISRSKMVRFFLIVKFPARCVCVCARARKVKLEL